MSCIAISDRALALNMTRLGFGRSVLNVKQSIRKYSDSKGLFTIGVYLCVLLTEVKTLMRIRFYIEIDVILVHFLCQTNLIYAGITQPPSGQ